jgi:hypothetical protein
MKYSLDNNKDSVAPLHVTTRRPKSHSTNMTPDAKRQKFVANDAEDSAVVTEAMKHPSKVPRPPKSSIKSLFEAALLSKDNSTSDQKYLAPAGILSFEQVLLPAIALEEEKLLKKMQAKVQRDAPQYRKVVEQTRFLVRKSMMAAMQAVAESRAKRCQQEQERREQLAHQRRVERKTRLLAKQQERERLLKEKQKLQEANAVEKKRMMQRQYPKNQELWKEVMLLTCSINQLEKEERMWISAEQGFIQSHDSSVTKPASKEIIVKATKDELQQETENSMKEIALSSTRIQQGLKVVQDIVQESERVRKELYQTYRKDHQFHGYQGANNPAGLIRFLSQE